MSKTQESMTEDITEYPSSHKVKRSQMDQDVWISEINEWNINRKKVIKLNRIFYKNKEKNLKVKIRDYETELNADTLKKLENELNDKLQSLIKEIKSAKIQKPSSRKENIKSNSATLKKPYYFSDQLSKYYSKVNLGCGFNSGLTELDLPIEKLQELVRLDCSNSKNREKFFEIVGGKQTYVDACKNAEKKFKEDLKGSSGDFKSPEINTKNISDLINPQNNIQLITKNNISPGTSSQTLTSIVNYVNNTKKINSSYFIPTEAMNEYLLNEKLILSISSEPILKVSDVLWKNDKEKEKFMRKHPDESKTLSEVLTDLVLDSTLSSIKKQELKNKKIIQDNVNKKKQKNEDNKKILPNFISEKDKEQYEGVWGIKHTVNLIIDSCLRIPSNLLNETQKNKLEDSTKEANDVEVYLKRMKWGLKKIFPVDTK
uniref:Uncharacterized protein n=1 Tax=viral metagenome TaxID=1070528 RepID=A0A6C0AEW5_9ZZZZ